jgi:GNAT superfamily N-acetyltransferase
MKFIHYTADGRERASLLLEHDHSQQFFLQWFDLIKDAEPVEISQWADLVRTALQHAKSDDARSVRIRITESGNWLSQIAELTRLGFTKESDRIEFRHELSELPGDQGSPLRWEAMAPLGAVPEHAAANVLKHSSIGDPGGDPNEDALAALRGELADSILTSGPECVQVAYLDEKVVGIVIAQINPKTKWSRISYMGLLPEYRGLQLGKWVHRHGFEMMRAQGGELYHGGTHAGNASMLRLFHSHGCTEYRRMQEWVYR